MEKKYILFKNNTEYTFEKYTDSVFQKQTSIQSLFNGSIFKNCEMNNSDFSKSDFEGTIWTNLFVDNCFFTMMQDDEAVVTIVDSNLQREQITPSEKAYAYKMKYDDIKKKAGRKNRYVLYFVKRYVQI